MRPDKAAVRLDPGLEILAERLSCVETTCVLATVIATAGSTYSKAGARMLIEPDGQITGLLSGGCLEQDLREHASAILTGGGARTVTYDMRADNDLVFGVGAGCAGWLQILLEPLRRDDRAGCALRLASERSRTSAPTALIVIHEGPAARRGTYLLETKEMLAQPLAAAAERAVATARSREFRWVDSDGAQAAWIQSILPLPAILICGAGPDAAPLAAAFHALRFPVTVTDHRPAYARAEHFPGTAVTLGSAATLGTRHDLSRFFAAIVMSHHLASDVDYLRTLARSEVAYLGVLGPQMRRQRLLDELEHVAPLLDRRLRGPIGLEIGAITPAGIALAVAAEVHAAAASHNAMASERRETPPVDRARVDVLHEGSAS